MKNSLLRHIVLAIAILLAACWSISSARENGGAEQEYKNSKFLAEADWLTENLNKVIVVDVRDDKYFDGKIIEGAIRMPWNLFRHDDKSSNTASRFVGINDAEKILGDHGISRSASIVLYDSIERDGGATASYLFWILDTLGHQEIKVLNGGIDAWVKSGGKLDSKPAKLPAITYNAPVSEIKKDKLITGDFINSRLGDIHYQIVDVRSKEEYLGEKGTKGINGEPLKLGHIPTAYNVNYVNAWENEKTKKLKSFAELKQLYSGLAPTKTIVVYCNSGRRSSFSYFVLRLMGYDMVITYEPSWKEWGNPAKHFPVETSPNKLEASAAGWGFDKLARNYSGENNSTSSGNKNSQKSKSSSQESKYVSCGG